MKPWFRPPRLPGRHRTGTPVAEILGRASDGRALDGPISGPLRARGASTGEINPTRPNMELVRVDVEHQGHPVGAGPNRTSEGNAS